MYIWIFIHICMEYCMNILLIDFPNIFEKLCCLTVIISQKCRWNSCDSSLLYLLQNFPKKYILKSFKCQGFGWYNTPTIFHLLTLVYELQIIYIPICHLCSINILQPILSQKDGIIFVAFLQSFNSVFLLIKGEFTWSPQYIWKYSGHHTIIFYVKLYNIQAGGQ